MNMDKLTIEEAFIEEISKIAMEWREKVLQEARKIAQQEREAMLEMLMERKYRNHDPKEDCDCDVCHVLNPLIEELKKMNFYRCPKCRSTRNKKMSEHLFVCLDCKTYRMKGREVYWDNGWRLKPL
ncbi:MAG: hypothetical protein KGI72_06055, partial [Patescibacteria group bacterium]|nr:hypothetical protein [Patescibacteria group bacterium]